MNSNPNIRSIGSGSIILLIGLTTLFAVSCEKNVFSPEYAQSADGLGLTLQVNSSFITTGDNIEFNLQLVNLTKQRREWLLSSSQTCDLIIYNQASENIWQFGYKYYFAPVVWYFSLHPHEQKAFTITCQDTVPPGNYTAIGWFLFAPTLQDTASFVVLSEIIQ